MKTLYLILVLTYFIQISFAQNSLTVTESGVVLKPNASPQTVASPSKGTVIFNAGSSSPNYYNGNQWFNLAGTAIASLQPDSIMYRLITFPAGYGFNLNYYKLESFDNDVSKTVSLGGPGGISTGQASQQNIRISKKFDNNSIGFRKAFYNSPNIQKMEFWFYKKNQVDPYQIVELTNFQIIGATQIISTNNELLENWVIIPIKIKFTNFTTGKFVEYDQSTFMATSN